MPIHKNPDGTWQWGKSGKKYKNKEDAVKQMKAIFANGYVEKKASSLLLVLSGDKLTDLQAKRILALIIKLHRDHDKYLDQGPFDHLLRDIRLKYIKSPDTRIITDNHDKPNSVGVVLQHSDDPKDARWLTALYVKPLLRGRGIGEAIINQALKTALLMGSLKLKLGYYAANPASRLYLRLGYKPKLIIALKLLKKKAALSLQLLKLRVAPYYTEDRKKHIQDVLKYALKLKGSKLSPLLLAIIYYHDILKKRVGGIGHLLAGAKFALKDLKKLYTKDQVRRVAQAIRLHSPDYRMSIKNFRHSSPLALLLALADDMNVRHRDPDVLALRSVRFVKQHPLMFFDDPLIGYNRHISYFGPHHSHKNLKYYKKLWDRLMARPIKLVDNYPKLRFMELWNKIKADSLIPDIDSIYYNPDNIVYE